MAFWLILVLITIVVLLILAATMLTGGAIELAPPGASDMQIYRDQLSELERDLARGTLAPDEAERTRVEISRRILAADKAQETATAAGRAPSGATYAAIGVVAAVLLGGGYAAYSALGVNQLGGVNYGDLPLSDRIEAAEELRESRPSQAEVEATLPAWPGPPEGTPSDYLELIEKVRVAVASRPGDIPGNELLAQHEAQLGNYIAAHHAKATAIEAMQGQAKAGDYAQYIDLLALAAGGYVSPEAEAALIEVFKRDPENLVARYYSGLLFAQIGRPDQAFNLWRALLRDSPAEAGWIEPVRAQIGQLAAMAGVEYTLPPLAPAPGTALAGPSSEDMQAASEMNDEDRAAMIENMVSQLMTRLASEGGSAREWAQLIGALGALGRTDKAGEIYAEAQQTFAASPEDLAIITRAASGAGVAVTAQDPARQTDGVDRMRQLDNIATNLADKLATEGGTASEWATLIETLGLMGETERAAQVWAEAGKVFAPHPTEMELIRKAAVDAGVIQ